MNDDPRSAYLNHLKHLQVRKNDPDYWAADCQACRMHKEAEERANREIKERAATKEQAWWRYEQ